MPSRALVRTIRRIFDGIILSMTWTAGSLRGEEEAVLGQISAAGQ